MAEETGVKKYPAEAMEKLEKMLTETKETRAVLDKLDTDLLHTPNLTIPKIQDLARQAVGAGNYLRKKLAVLTSAVKNERSHRYMEIKLECSTSGAKFTDGSAREESEGYVGPLRTARDVLEAYVTSADNVVSFSRMYLSSQSLDQSNQVSVN